MLKQKKIYVVYGSHHDISWINNSVVTNKLENADALLLTGGGDVHPRYYNGMDGIKDCYYYNYEEPGSRCVFEWEVINEAITKNIPIIGICRGFQWCCVAAGGKLIQDIHNHSHSNGVIVDDRIYETNSLHHQMIYPWNLPEEDYSIIGYINKPSSTLYKMDGKVLENVPYEIEIAYFPKIQAIGTQFHPEMMGGINSKYSYPILTKLNEILLETIWKK